MLKWGLRKKVLTLSSLLLLLPWFAYQFVIEMENFLRLGQEQTLLGNTSAVATALHEKPSLFNEHANFLPEIQKGHDLYVYDLKDAITIDGKKQDWAAIESFKNIYTSSTLQSDNAPTQLNLLLGKQNNYLYAYLQVFNQSLLKQPIDSVDIDMGEHLSIAMQSPQGKFNRYIISAQRQGWFNAYQYPQHSLHAKDLTRIKNIQGYLKSTTYGYDIELRIPLSLLGDKLGFKINTFSNNNGAHIEEVIETSNLLDSQQLGSVLIPSPEVEKMLLTMSHTRSTLWVVDRHQRVIAKAGDIHQATGAWSTDLTLQKQSGWLTSIENALVSPIYDWFLQQPNNDFNDQKANPTQLNFDLIEQALKGEPISEWRLSADKKVNILSVAQPIFSNGKVIGVVLAEETSNGILNLRNQAFQKMFNVLLIIILIVGLLLFLFLSQIVKRIRNLRDQSENMLDKNGRLTGNFHASNHNDEIGDLSRSMENMGKRLSEYNHYIEQLASRLSHELRTPVAVVRSSLDNLAAMSVEPSQQKYIERSQQGIQRLNKILTSMSEASRIEKNLQQGEKHPISLSELLSNCMHSYTMIYPNSLFNCEIENNELLVIADPDFLVQVFDKLINNAVEFSNEQQKITVKLYKDNSRESDRENTKENNTAKLSIENSGPLLNIKNSQDLFQSMISIRPVGQQHEAHLGLGLYIAKMICDYHDASLTINNNPDLNGVIVTITFALK